MSGRSLAQDLASVGVHVANVFDLVNQKGDYPVAVPVLLDWLTHLEERVPEHPNMAEGIVRALAVPSARGRAGPALIRLFRTRSNHVSPELRWAIANTLSVVAHPSDFEELKTLAMDRSYGRARQMLMPALAQSGGVRAIPVLLGLLDDDEVAAHAISALAKLRAHEAKEAISKKLEHPVPLVRREAAKALKRLQAAPK